MFVTEEEAAAIYARACRSWYGIKADSVVNSQIRALMARGDRKGVAAWRRVAGALKNQKAQQQGHRDPTLQEIESQSDARAVMHAQGGRVG
jgi:hypothetical protein